MAYYQSYNSQSSPESTDILGNINRIFSTLGNKLEKDVKDHLKNVYGTLTLCLITATLGVIVNSVLGLYNWHFLFSIGSIGLMIALTATEASRANEKKRLAYMFGLAFLVGCTTGPLIEYVGMSDPAIVFNAYVITMIVFGCFTMAALHAESTKFLHLGGILSAGLLCLLITSLFASYGFVHSIVLWGGLALNCGFIVYDTQLIAEKRRRGDQDYIWHAVMLFIDFVNVFRYILILLKEKSDSDNRSKRRR
ncbi:inhibitor of apoptosis-promoting bax1 domain-containing protein [Ditylenchus destructor]|uniref:Inhibitor of apoptosis-promoting bax1 domain-containing protein n=1 Tax=Ditylenchus destructor TaxID=166010 RepID=A0AAD4NA89_9BILA|nr:inhibitor of apoptosis-promoting bax1 domain-containing protein [Ditylenchus destructor]